MTSTDIANLGISKIGHGGDQTNINGANLIADITGADEIAQKCNFLYPVCRQKAISDLAVKGSPFRETVKYANLGPNLFDSDYSTGTISVTNASATVTGTGTVWTTALHASKRIEISGVSYTVLSVESNTSLTLSAVYAGDADDELSYNITDLPEVSNWEYAFTLPSDCLAVVKQKSEVDGTFNYQFEKILNRAGTGWLFLTNTLSDADVVSAYIEYVIDQTTTSMFCWPLIECIAVLMAAELSPKYVSTDGDKRRYFLLQEYANMAVPLAMNFNQSQLDTYSKPKTSYLGGRG